MAPVKTACIAIGLVASAMGKTIVPRSAVYKLQGGGSGLETEGDYIENKIARGVYGSGEQVAKGVSSVFGTAAEEMKHAPKYARNAARSTRESARDIARSTRDSAREATRNVKGATRDAANSARENANASSRWFEEDVVDDRNAVQKFFQNPNNAFISQAITAFVIGGVHIGKYVEFISQFTNPVGKIFGLDYAAGTFGPHVRVVGAYLVGVLVSDLLAYKATSPGFKRGKIWHEMGSCIAIATVCLGELFTDEPVNLIPHAIAASIFGGWFTYLSQQY